MIYKIPIYLEVEVEGDFDPGKLSAAIERQLESHVTKVLKEYGGFPHTTKDLFDTLALSVAKEAEVSKIRINLVPRSQVLKKIASHVK